MRNDILKVAIALSIVCYTLQANSFTLTIKERQNVDTVQVIAESDSLFVKGKVLYNEKEFDRAIDFFLKSDSVINVYFGTDCPYYGYGKKWTSSCYYKLGMDSIALDYSIYYDKEPIDKLLTHKSDSIGWVALKLIDLGQYKEGADKLLEAAMLEKRELGPYSYWYANTLSNCTEIYSAIGNFAKAIELGREAVDIYKISFGVNHMNYASCLNNLAVSYDDSGNPFMAIQLGKEAIRIKKEIIGTEHPDYATDLSNLAEYNSSIGNYSEALLLGKEAMKIRKKLLGTDNTDYALSLMCLSRYYSDLGNYSEALRLGIDAMDILKKVLGVNHPYYATSLIYIANYYCCLGDYSKALQLGTEAMKIRKETLGIEHIDYLAALECVAYYNSCLHNYKESIKIRKDLLETYKQILGIEHPVYAQALASLAGSYADFDNYEAAIRLYNEALCLLQNKLGSEHPYYVGNLSNLANCYALTGRDSEAIGIVNEEIDVVKKKYGKEHPRYASLLRKLSILNLRLGNYKESYQLLYRGMDNSLSYMQSDFVNLPSNLRKSLWIRNYTLYYNSIFPFIVSKYRNKESISELYNKACLFSKGILLNTDMEIRNLVFESGDSTLIADYNNLTSNLSIFNKLICTPINKRLISTDSLYNTIQVLELEVAKKIKTYSNNVHNLTINWKEVQKNLGDNDIAIEFLDFQKFATDSILYVALTLKKGYDSPHFVTLFEWNQLKAIPEDRYYKQTDVSDLVWKPLQNELAGVKNIFFAPSGELHRIGIENLPISNTKNISDLYMLYRLSSTRQLVIHDKIEGKGSILYGGINYDEKSGVILKDSDSAEGGVLRSASSRANVDSLSLRSSFEYLEGTKREADMIAKDMKQHSIPYIYYSGMEGTEESFKRLNGTKPKAMHIATHGFYYTNKEIEESQYFRSRMDLMTDEILKTDYFVEDKPMTRSGLLFSGCNRAFRHEQIQEGEEDGILTAQEIAMLDLRGLDLVVLSACQTGLGDVISGEGVFGLQRGFKKAGANTILMSLNKVNDEATRILMVEFYRNLMNGKSKYQSLKDAQKHLREVENGKFDKPEYWASFIMLDGLN